MKETVIVGGSRTAIGSFGGALKTVPVVELGSIVMKDVLKKLGLRPVVSEAMMMIKIFARSTFNPICLASSSPNWRIFSA